MPALTPEQMNAAIQLNRAGGESYDTGTPMSMEEAINLAGQYGAVPSRISSGGADPNSGYSGIWAIPTPNGWVPLDKLKGGQATPSENWQGGPAQSQPGPQTQAQASAPWGNAPSMASPQQSPSAPQWPNAPSFAPPTGPPSMGNQYGPSMQSYPPSTSGPVGSLPPNQTQRYWDKQFGSDPQVQQQGQTPSINININGQGVQDWMKPQPGASWAPKPPPPGPPQMSGPRYQFPNATPPFTVGRNPNDPNYTQPYSPNTPDLNRQYQQGFGTMPPIGYPSSASNSVPSQGADYSDPYYWLHNLIPGNQGQ